MGLWKRSREPRAVVAAAGPAARRNLLNSYGTNNGKYREAWQNELDVYDEYGPGFVGSYLDLISERVATCDAFLTDFGANGEPKPVTDPDMLKVFAAAWAIWKGDYDDRYALLKKHARLRLKTGEAWVVRSPKGNFTVLHRNEILWGTASISYIDGITERRIEVPIVDPPGTLIPSIWRSWTPLDTNSRLANSDLKRAIPHIREYVNVKLRQDSDTVSPLVRNKILVFGSGTEVYDDDDDENDPRNGMPDAYVDYLKLAQNREGQQYHQRRRSQDSVPFPMIGDKIEVVDMGRNTDPISKELEDAAINAFARAVRTPAQYIHSGPGIAKFSNEDHVAEAFITDAVAPTSKDVLGDIWRIVIYPVMISAYANLARVPVEVAEYRFRHIGISPDLDRIRPKINRVDELTAGFKTGAVSLKAVTDALDAPPLLLPPDVTEYDIWKHLTTPSGAQAAEVRVAAGLDIPKIPGVSAPALPQGGVDTSVPYNDLLPAVTASAAIIAAPDHEKAIRRRTFEDAAKTDEKLFVGILAAAQFAYAKAIEDASRHLSRSAPSSSDLKTRLASAETPQEKLAVLTKEDREKYGITPEILIPDGTFNTLKSQTKSTLQQELDRFAAAALGIGILRVRPAYEIDKAAETLATGLTEYARYRVSVGAPDPEASVPLTHIRDTLAVAGGGEPSRGDDVLKPVTAAASGPATVAVIDGVTPGFEWKHGYWGEPDVPDQRHVDLSGTRVPFSNGRLQIAAIEASADAYPGDHVNCSCAWIMSDGHATD